MKETTSLNDQEKVVFLIEVLGSHINKLPSESNFAYYLESILAFLRTSDSILQKAAFSNSELFIDIISNDLNFKKYE
ncbi:hypothetical protein M5X06_11615 [Paenibacillus alvei]|uniref:Uncharacterized protein n=1 Tax=Paenibacillus alvei TaxID=44250 RepID=A0ABT4H3H1_PAEAL|nr:hypothetical protein [Paenibacillus alvei]MCY9763515.1 hypothetical protein [Paenibacillus alvei]MCY9767473.1 hypothetical protein [Paenibacillus alvei]